MTFFYESLTSQNVLHIGGFNEKIQCYDLRQPKKILLSSDPQGGGIWRMDGKLIGQKEHIAICTCSGNEFRVLDDECNVIGEFVDFLDTLLKAHSSSDDSWAYGVSWVDKDRNTDQRLLGCSFYDKSTYMFNFQDNLET